MKKAIIGNICCEGCAKDVKHLLESIFGITNVSVSFEGGYATFEGFVSTKVISDLLASEGYQLIEIIKL
ncbi:MAG: heavy-metal-associated domain-containing protein [Firmicutes bacterium]|nr:heavy-metal-associated domain-containing protein [Bacillota bacterium]